MYTNDYDNNIGCDGLGCVSCGEDCGSEMDGLGYVIRRKKVKKRGRMTRAAYIKMKQEQADAATLKKAALIEARKSANLAAILSKDFITQAQWNKLPVILRVDYKLKTITFREKSFSMWAKKSVLAAQAKARQKRKQKMLVNSIKPTRSGPIQRRKRSGSLPLTYAQLKMLTPAEQAEYKAVKKYSVRGYSTVYVRGGEVGIATPSKPSWGVSKPRLRTRPWIRRGRSARFRQAATLRQKAAIRRMQAAADRRVTVSTRQKAIQAQAQKAKVAQAEAKAIVTKRNYKAIKANAEVDPTITNAEMTVMAKKDMNRAKANLRQVKIIGPEGMLPTPVQRKITNPMTPMTSVEEYDREPVAPPVEKKGMGILPLIAGAGVVLLLLLRRKRRTVYVSPR